MSSNSPEESPNNASWQQNSPSLLDPHKEIQQHRYRLPHWQQDDAHCFITWRLADSIPASKLRDFKIERDAWLRFHPEPWDQQTEAEFRRRFLQRVDDWLDEGSGSCLLGKADNAKIVSDTIRYFDSTRYDLYSFVVMPNHVHILFSPRDGYRIEKIISSWKGYSSRRINQRTGHTGSLWQAEYWDTLIRNERHLFKCAEYIRNNPAKANLREGTFLYFERNDDARN